MSNQFYHVLNRGNSRSEVFFSPDDYQEFISLMFSTIEGFPVEVYSFCLMPNHFHLLIRPREAQGLSKWLQLFMTKQVRLYHKRNRTSGHLWQGRYKLFPVQKDPFLEVVMRYIERNPLRANLVSKAEDWKWSSLWRRVKNESEGLGVPSALSEEDWVSWVNKPMTDQELDKLRNCVNRCAPFGSDRWVKKKATEMGLESTIRPRGRPKKL